MTDKPKNTGEFDILIANSIYPEAESIFTTRLRMKIWSRWEQRCCSRMPSHRFLIQ